jgi:flavin-dependent thymidylate synthase
LKIELAGYNVDTEILNRLKSDQDDTLTPETFSAAYARISRSSDDITTLRKKARQDVEKARKSNKTIIFEMGHHSVAEHAVFNFDIIGISRLALEEIEKFRLASYTEKSQRYVTLRGDYVLPVEITDSESIRQFKNTINIQNQFYQKSFKILSQDLQRKYPERNQKKSEKRLLENLAKEDARYILSLATEGQVGLTINARNIEHLLRRFSLSQSHEVREMGDRIFKLSKKIAPSIILFPEPSEYDCSLKQTLRDQLDTLPVSPSSYSDPEIIYATPDGDDMILAAFLSLHGSSGFRETLETVKRLSTRQKKSICRNLFHNMEFFDSPPREFEIPSITFQAFISASNFAQLKRHRIATLLSGDYDTRLGNTIPESICQNGLEAEFREIIDTTNRVYQNLKEQYGQAANYILTNSHRRMVIMKMNLRELYHFIRLRDDHHAQWDIKSLARTLMEQVKELMPLSTLLLCGKSDFENLYQTIFKTKPKCHL